MAYFNCTTSIKTRRIFTNNLKDLLIQFALFFFLTSSRAEELMPDFDRIRVLLHSNGRLHWEPGGIFKTTCDIDIAYFPFDSQNCPLVIGSYSYYRFVQLIDWLLRCCTGTSLASMDTGVVVTRRWTLWLVRDWIAALADHPTYTIGNGHSSGILNFRGVYLEFWSVIPLLGIVIIQRQVSLHVSLASQISWGSLN